MTTTAMTAELAGPVAGDRTRLAQLTLVGLVLLLVAAATLALLTGASDASLPRLLSAYMAGATDDPLVLRDQLVFLASDSQLRDFTFWSMGSLAGSNWQKVQASGPIILIAVLCCMLLTRGLNALTLGEATAMHLGIPVQRLKRIAIVAVAAATGAAVAVSGGIGFIGIIVPHLLRLVIGPDH